MKKHLQNEKKIKTENEKVANRKLGNLGNVGKVIPSFHFFPTAKIENSDSKISEKTFQDFRGFRVFDLVKFTSFFISNVFFSIQRQCWVIFSWVKPQILFSCSNIILLRYFLYLEYLCLFTSGSMYVLSMWSVLHYHF